MDTILPGLLLVAAALVIGGIGIALGILAAPSIAAIAERIGQRDGEDEGER